MSPRRAAFKLRLYIADHTENSESARTNLLSICEDYLAGCCEVEIIDVLTEPERAFDDRILMTPTLVRLSPLPVRRIVGTLTPTTTVLHALGVDGTSA